MFPLRRPPTGTTRSSCSRSGSTCRPRTRWSTPHFTMLWDHDIPRHVARDDAGRATEVTVIAGRARRARRRPPRPAPLVGARARGRPGHLAPAARARRRVGAAAAPPGPTRCARCTCSRASLADRRPRARPRHGRGGARRRAASPVAGGRRRRRVPDAAGAPHRRAGGPGRAVRDEHRGRDPPGLRRLPAPPGSAVGRWPADDPVHGRDQGRFARHADGSSRCRRAGRVGLS